MLKGSQKKMIVVRTRDSHLFEEAYFVMRGDSASRANSGRDMLAEADRIINGNTDPENSTASAQRRVWRWRQALWFIAGVFCGSGIVLLLRYFV